MLYYINTYFCYYAIIVIKTTTILILIHLKVISSVMTAEVDGLSSPLHLSLVLIDVKRSLLLLAPPTEIHTDTQKAGEVFKTF